MIIANTDVWLTYSSPLLQYVCGFSFLLSVTLKWTLVLGLSNSESLVAIDDSGLHSLCEVSHFDVVLGIISINSLNNICWILR